MRVIKDECVHLELEHGQSEIEMWRDTVGKVPQMDQASAVYRENLYR